MCDYVLVIFTAVCTVAIRKGKSEKISKYEELIAALQANLTRDKGLCQCFGTLLMQLVLAVSVIFFQRSA